MFLVRSLIVESRKSSRFLYRFLEKNVQNQKDDNDTEYVMKIKKFSFSSYNPKLIKYDFKLYIVSMT